MTEFKEFIAVLAYGIEGFGVLVIVIGCAVATIRFLLGLRGGSPDETYEIYRRRLGRSVILGLEFLIAGDVVRTVIVSHTLSSVAVLGLIVLVRAFLSFTLALEVEGRWPWQRPGTAEPT